MSYEAHRDAASHYSNEMVRLFTPGHNATQTAPYEANRKQYLREEVLKMWVGSGIIPPPENVT